MAEWPILLALCALASTPLASEVDSPGVVPAEAIISDSLAVDGVVSTTDSPVVLAGEELSSVASPGVLHVVADPMAVPFEPGERLEFALEYGLVRAGKAVMAVGPVEERWGRKCVELSTRATSAEAFRFVFSVDDLVTSLMDLETLYSWRFEKRLREGSYRKDESVVFDQANHLARYDDGKLYRVPPGVQDVLSALYYVRTRDIAPGDTLFIANHTDRKNYDLAVRIGEREQIETPAGSFQCLRVEPELKAEGIFRHQGRLEVWMTDDARHLPVLMKSKVVIGSVAAILERWRPAEGREWRGRP